MRRFVLAGLIVLALPCSATAAKPSVRAGDARATTTGGTATLSNDRLTRTWKTSGGVVTTSLRSANGSEWSNGNSPDFSLDLNGVPTSSTSVWSLRSVAARTEPRDPARPDRKRGAQLVFTYGLDPVGLITLERTYTLRPGAAVIGVTSTLHNGGPAPLRISSYSLDELTSGRAMTGHVLTYHGGSDWRDDYRVASTH